MQKSDPASSQKLVWKRRRYFFCKYQLQWNSVSVSRDFSLCNIQLRKPLTNIEIRLKVTQVQLDLTRSVSPVYQSHHVVFLAKFNQSFNRKHQRGRTGDVVCERKLSDVCRPIKRFLCDSVDLNKARVDESKRIQQQHSTCDLLQPGLRSRSRKFLGGVGFLTTLGVGFFVRHRMSNRIFGNSCWNCTISFETLVETEFFAVRHDFHWF